MDQERRGTSTLQVGSMRVSASGLRSTLELEGLQGAMAPQSPTPEGWPVVAVEVGPGFQASSEGAEVAVMAAPEAQVQLEVPEAQAPEELLVELEAEAEAVEATGRPQAARSA